MAAITSAITSASPALLPSNIRRKRTLVSAIGEPPTSVVTYYFRRTDGTRGNVNAPEDVPVGAVIERVV